MANFGLGTVADQFSGGASTSDVFLEGAEELAICFTTIDVTDMGLGADIELGARGTVVDGRRIRVDIVSGNRFIATEDVEGRELCLMMPV